MIELSSIIYREGNFFTTSLYQNSTYMGVTYTHPLTWDSAYEITEPLHPSLNPPTISNYPVMPSHFFMGSFDGFWVHKIYSGDQLVMTVQGVDQDLFIPVFHDRVESVCMATQLDGDDIDTTADCPPDVPSSGAMALLVIAAFGLRRRNR